MALEMALWVRQRAGQDIGGLVHPSDAGSQGEINRPSQHLDYMEVFGGSSATGCGSCGAAGDEAT